MVATASSSGVEKSSSQCASGWVSASSRAILRARRLRPIGVSPAKRLAERASTAVADAAGGGVTDKEYVEGATPLVPRRLDRSVVTDPRRGVTEVLLRQLCDHLAAPLVVVVPGRHAGGVHVRGQHLPTGPRPVRLER